MRKLLFLLFITIALSSCRKDFEFEPNTGGLSFSKDTVYLDTVFTNIGSSTYRLKVYNKTDKDISIPKVQLGKGINSKYRLMIDGMTGDAGAQGKIFSNVELLAKDSLFIFIEVTSDVASANPSDFLYTDQIQFTNVTGAPQTVELVTLIQDAIFIYPNRTQNVDNSYTYENISLGLDTDGNEIKLIGSNLSETDPVNGDELHWTNAKPYVIYGNALVPNGKILVVDAGARVHFHANSSLIVNQTASIQVNVNGGNPPGNNPENITNEVIFEGDRLEPSFANVPGQWGSVILLSELNTNTINHLTIKNATVGLLAQKRLLDEDDIHQPKVTITNSQIYNCSNVGILSRDAQITGSNLVINYCGEASLAATLGGSYNFTHCTFNNNWNSSSQVAVLLSNYLETSTALYVSDLNAANFNNCIIYGSNQIEMFLDKISPTLLPSSVNVLFNYKFNHCLIKFNNINNQFTNNPLYPPTNTTDYTSCSIATNSSTFNPKFKNVAKNKLWLNEVWNTAIPYDVTFSNFPDIVNNPRSGSVALGAYQFVP
jgi:hypothetical protein